MQEGRIRLRYLLWVAGSTHFPEVIRTYNARKVRFSATVGGEAEIEVALV
jgi:hypothetical protein